MKVHSVPGAGIRSAARWSITTLTILGLIMILGVAPALAHGGEEEADPVDLVEQALAIVVNTPDAVGEALERVEAALAAETENPSGELDLAALEEAVAALNNGDLHDAEDALIQALGQDPHANEQEIPGAGEPAEQAEPETPSDTTPTTAPATGEETEPGHDEVEEADQGHGLTSRVEGGFSTPGSGELAALGAALLLALGGIALVRGKE